LQVEPEPRPSQQLSFCKWKKERKDRPKRRHLKQKQPLSISSLESSTMTTYSTNTPDLRHVTSSGDLLTPISPHSHRDAAHSKEHSSKARPAKLSTGPQQASTPPRVGTRSPSEIPSSPSSIHSSNSAIFERDIEPLPAALMSTVESINGHTHPASNGSPNAKSSPHGPHHPNLNPQIIENAVPAVLDSAIAALTEDSKLPSSDPATMNISVIGPTSPSAIASGALTPTGMNSPGHRNVSSSRAVSVSKARNIGGASGPSSVVGGSRSPSPTRRSFSVNLTTGQVSPGSQSPRPAAERQNSLTTPGVPGAFVSSPAGSSVNVSPSMSPISNIMSLSAQDGVSSPATEAQSHSPSHSQGGLSPLVSPSSKRLSFVSYSDILNSTPISTVAFSSIITSDELPPHIPAVMGSNPENTVPASGSSTFGSDSGEWLGGEYEKEGFGRGLEARLEAVLNREHDTHSQTGLATLPEPENEVPIGTAH